MDWIMGMQTAIDYIENHLAEKLDYNDIAKRAYVSSFHFQRVFSIMCGYTVGEYIRNRRLTLAGSELSATRAKVIDVALKYGYDTPDGFTKAFTRFHGLTPSSAREKGAKLKSFSRLTIKILLEGGSVMDYSIEEKNAFELVGYKRSFTGDAGERFDQERDFWVQTREEQDVLSEIRKDTENIWYDINRNYTDDGYDHYIGVMSDKPAPKGFEEIKIPALTFAVFKTGKAKYPTMLLTDLRKNIVSEWLPSSDYVLAEGPEVTVTHWYPIGTEDKHIEIWIPIEKK